MATRIKFQNRTGFTLIELMIAIGLGMLIVFTAAAGLRTVSQSISRSNALARENTLLRCGMLMAFDEVDYWIRTDDPTDKNKQPLRAVNNGVGLPFTPFRLLKDPVTGNEFVDKKPGLNEDPNNPRGGWNPNPLAWAAWDSRTWTRANMTEKDTAGDGGPRNQNWGTFGIYENLDYTKSWHHWYGGQVLGVMDALGFYGAYEYLPSNSFFIYHTENRAQIPKLAVNQNLSWGGCPIALMLNDDWWGNRDGADATMKGRVRNSNGGTYFFPSPYPEATPKFHSRYQNTDLFNVSRAIAKIGYEGRDVGWNADRAIKPFHAVSNSTDYLLQTRPETWQNVTYSVQRFMTRAHFTTVATIRSENPITGEVMSFSFKTLGTTLRGARQQRLPDEGWADPFAGPTLDYEFPNPMP